MSNKEPPKTRFSSLSEKLAPGDEHIGLEKCLKTIVAVSWMSQCELFDFFNTVLDDVVLQWLLARSFSP